MKGGLYIVQYSLYTWTNTHPACHVTHRKLIVLSRHSCSPCGVTFVKKLDVDRPIPLTSESVWYTNV